eukprot:TRINITY_DN23312_c0_g1_i1.p1 TRINITY_DN23312_c0_g1~~TRINITY_DN23312_c0_g1_i1.p1  ORF type:complete len:427 (+),score=102.83 TRINITY_DN23312_c0_g1_i1:79-1281(+)
MVHLSVVARVAVNDTFEVDIDSEETVESLSVVIFSMRPELGEELRLVYKGRLLKPEMTLADAGVQSGEHIAIAKKPSAQPAALASEAPAPVATATPAAAAPAEDHAMTPVDPTANAPAATTQPAQETGTETTAQDSSVPTSMTVEGSAAATPSSEEPPVKRGADDADSDEGGQNAKKAKSEASVEAEGGAEEKGEVPGEPPAEEKAEAEAKTDSDEPDIDLSSTEAMKAYADALENGSPMPRPEKLAAALRKAASHVENLEGVVSEFGKALHIVNMISANSLRGVGLPAGNSQEGGSHEDSGRSFLIKKGDADVQELHRAASTPTRPQSSSISGSGSLSSAAKPMTKEEMDKARQARLQMLEKQQAEKRKEREDAEEKGKARDAMFNRPFVGPQKQMGQH